MTTSGSIPFSLASASIVCCRGFDIFDSHPPAKRAASELHFQICASDNPDPDPMTLSAGVLDHDDRVSPVVVEPDQPSTQERLAIDRFLHDQLRLPSREPAIVGDIPKWPIEARRRYLERVRHRDDLLDV